MIFFVIIAVILLYPFALFAAKRILAFISVKRICKKKGFSLIKTHFAVPFSSITDPRCDIHIATADTVYSVKLCGLVSTKIFFAFSDPAHYLVKHYRFQFFGNARSVDYTVKSKRAYDFGYALPDAFLAKRPIRVLLLSPLPTKIGYTDRNQRKEASPGDDTGEGIFHSLASFTDLLNKS